MRQSPGPSDNQEVASQLAKQGFEYGKQTMSIVSEADTELWEIVCDVPRLGGAYPYIVFILNIILPGIGTMLTACFGYSQQWSKT